jgi:hypothetical protein
MPQVGAKGIEEEEEEEEEEEGESYVGVLDVEGIMTLKGIIKKQDVRMWA